MLFENITPKSAYLFGFWLADGWLSYRKRRGKYRKFFGICSTDEQIIYDLSLYIGCNYEKCKRRKKNGKLRKAIYKVEFRDDDTFDYCYNKLGTIYKSTYPIYFPFLQSNIDHQVRGYFDGDGSLHYVNYINRHGNKATQLRSSFTAGINTGPLLINLRDFLTLHLGLYKKKLTGKVHRKLIYSQYDTMLLCRWLYANQSMCLHRKRDIWRNADINKLQSSIKFHHKYAA